MTLRSFLTPTIVCFLMVVSVAIFVNVKTPPIIINNQEIIATPTEAPITITPTTSTTVTQPVVTPKATIKPTPVTCIVTVNGKRYNVISLKRTHSGPRDIFVCGKDITKDFKSFHGSDYSIIARYII